MEPTQTKETLVLIPPVFGLVFATKKGVVQNPKCLGSCLWGRPNRDHSGSVTGEIHLECLSHFLTTGFHFPSRQAIFKTRRRREDREVRSSPLLHLNGPWNQVLRVSSRKKWGPGMESRPVRVGGPGCLPGLRPGWVTADTLHSSPVLSVLVGHLSTRNAGEIDDFLAS